MEGGASSSSSTSNSRPQIIYALITRGPSLVLAEYTGMQGAFQQAAIQVLSRMEAVDDFKSYFYGDGLTFHCLMQPAIGLCFVCMADKNMGRRLPFGFLDALKEQFNQLYAPPQVHSAVQGGMQLEFGHEMQALVEKFNSPNADRVHSLMNKVKDVNDKVVESIDKLLLRQDKIDILVDRTQLLSESSNSFRREAERVRRVVWWRNMRVLMCIITIVVIAIAVVVVASCGIDFKKC
mmetsp:Transcript_85743/g.276722  ORF Transcript_85743/g.276722 Transcript_85743/m.276722 type:complete len:236 (-) Transcript_85743:2-709(-)